MSSSAGRYTWVAVSLHWLLALAIVLTFCMGLYMTGLPFSPQRLKLYSWHKWAGVSILALSALRLLWRLSHRPPADLPMPAWQRLAAHGTHHLLYLLFFAVPLAGWAFSSSSGFPIVLFGRLPLPSFVPPDKDMAEVYKALHACLAYAMAALVTLHIAAALKHQFIDRDGLISRMLPSLGKTFPAPREMLGHPKLSWPPPRADAGQAGPASPQDARSDRPSPPSP